MSAPLGPIGPKVLQAGATAAAKAPEKEKNDKLAQAAKQMESVFVRELLKAAKVGGPKSDQGYGAMAVDSLADAVEAGGGFGLARRIQDAIDQSTRGNQSAQAQNAQAAHISPQGSAQGTVPVIVTGTTAGSHEE